MCLDPITAGEGCFAGFKARPDSLRGTEQGQQEEMGRNKQLLDPLFTSFPAQLSGELPPPDPATPKTSVLTMSTLNQIPLLRDIIKDLFARAASLAMTRCCSLGVFPSRSRNWLHCTGRWIYAPFRWLSFSDIKLGQLGLPSWEKVCHTLWVHAQIRSTKLQKFHKSNSPLQHSLDASIIES